MKVFTLQPSAGPNGNLDAERVVDVPDPFGRHLIAVGAARAAVGDEKVNARWPHGTDVPKPEKAEPEAK